jgi:ech hydrogenase subunit A
MMLIGMAGVFLAPFGMLISKWAVLKAVVDACPALTVFIVFGSSATLFFWVKWMGKLLEVVRPQPPVTEELGWGEAVALSVLSAGTFLTCLLFPFISSRFIEPYVLAIYGQSASMGQGNVLLMTIMMAMVTLFPLSFLLPGRGAKVMNAYLGGANADQSSVRFRTAAGAVQDVTLQNYYFGGAARQAQLLRWGIVAGAALTAGIVALACL